MGKEEDEELVVEDVKEEDVVAEDMAEKKNQLWISYKENREEETDLRGKKNNNSILYENIPLRIYL